MWTVFVGEEGYGSDQGTRFDSFGSVDADEEAR